MTGKKLEVFQDLNLRSSGPPIALIRSEILSAVKSPWRHEGSREEEMKRSATSAQDMIVLARDAFDEVDESCLVLWEDTGGYRVSNIVPRNIHELGISKYNAVLRDFVVRVAKPAAMGGAFTIVQTSDSQSIDDWIDAISVDRLRRFSNLANKSTGASHPLDQERWFAFLIQTHESGSQLDPGHLARWLRESEGWPDDTAHDLARDYEFARALLKQYDSTRR